MITDDLGVLSSKRIRRVTTAKCPLSRDWLAWSPEKQADRLFMICPACGQYGSHVGQGGNEKGQMVAKVAAAKCVVPDCPFRGDRQHARRYDEIERTEGRAAADRFDVKHTAWMECDDCGRTDGTHDMDVEH